LVRQAVGLLVSLLVVTLVATIGGWGSAQAGSFYIDLVRPAWAPPGWVFGPVWTLLYIMMAVSAWLVWREKGHTGRRIALLIYGAQLLLNALWSWIFFVWQQGALAFIECLLLALAILLTIHFFRKVDSRAAWLLLPYFLWVCFATVLTWNLWRNNPGIL